MGGRVLSGAIILGLYLFLLAPILIVFIVSFSIDPFLIFPPSAWGFKWYGEILRNPEFTRAFRLSFSIALVVTTIGLMVGTLAAFVLGRFQFRGRDGILGFFTAPLLIPSIVLGLSLLLVFLPLGLVSTFRGLVLGHLLVVLPYVIRILVVAFQTMSKQYEEAALSLGAPPWVVFWRVTLPLITPSLVASAALAFILSFDEVVISLFLVGSRVKTLPVAIYEYVEFRTDPQIAALSVLLILLSILIVLIIERTVGLFRAIR
jgi:putative spermidine/putrescine transport system permease protein